MILYEFKYMIVLNIYQLTKNNDLHNLAWFYHRDSKLMEIQRSTIKITFLCKSFEIPYMKHILKPIDYANFQISIFYAKKEAVSFIKNFFEWFDILSDLGSWIYLMSISLKYWKNQDKLQLETAEAISLLSYFGIQRISLNEWYISNEWFKHLLEVKKLEQISFTDWIFWLENALQNNKYDINQKLTVWFDNWKYTGKIIDKLTRYNMRNTIDDDGLARFFTDFMNIQDLAKYLNNWLINKSFGINEQHLNKKLLENIANYWNKENDVDLNNLLNNLCKYMIMNLYITDVKLIDHIEFESNTI